MFDVQDAVRDLEKIGIFLVAFGEKNVKIQDYVVCDERFLSFTFYFGFFNELLPNADLIFFEREREKFSFSIFHLKFPYEASNDDLVLVIG